MIKHLIDKFGSTIYVQIWENRIKVVDVASGASFDDVPLVAIEKKEKGQKVIVAVGKDAKSIPSGSNIEVVNPFSHPRALLNDFFVAEKLVQHAFHSVLGKKFISSAPAVVVHPMDKIEGGLTMIEKKAFRELAFGAGAREVELYQGPALSIMNFDFEQIKADNAKNENAEIRLKPKNENYLALFICVAVILCVLWLSN